MLPSPIRVIIADDHPIVREGLMATLTCDARIDVVATAASFHDLIAVLHVVHAEVLILDIGGMGNSPLGIVQRLTREQPHLGILVFSTSVDLVPEMVKAGAKGYVVKEELSDQLITAILAVRAGQTFISPIAQEYLLRCSIQSTKHRLTPQELSIVKLLAQGLGTTAVADQLSIDPRTVHNYTLKIRNKLGCDEQTQVVMWYQRLYGSANDVHKG